MTNERNRKYFKGMKKIIIPDLPVSRIFWSPNTDYSRHKYYQAKLLFILDWKYKHYNPELIKEVDIY